MQQDFLLSLVRSHGPQLNRFFAARVGETSEAQDLVQEVYLRLLNLERPDLICNPKAYVFRVASTLAHEHWLKRSARPPHVEWEDGADEASLSFPFIPSIHSGCHPHVLMVQAADSTQLNHSPLLRRVGRPSLRRVLI